MANKGTSPKKPDPTSTLMMFTEGVGNLLQAAVTEMQTVSATQSAELAKALKLHTDALAANQTALAEALKQNEVLAKEHRELQAGFKTVADGQSKQFVELVKLQETALKSNQEIVDKLAEESVRLQEALKTLTESQDKRFTEFATLHKDTITRNESVLKGLAEQIANLVTENRGLQESLKAALESQQKLVTENQGLQEALKTSIAKFDAVTNKPSPPPKNTLWTIQGPISLIVLVGLIIGTMFLSKKIVISDTAEQIAEYMSSHGLLSPSEILTGENTTETVSGQSFTKGEWAKKAPYRSITLLPGETSRKFSRSEIESEKIDNFFAPTGLTLKYIYRGWFNSPKERELPSTESFSLKLDLEKRKEKDIQEVQIINTTERKIIVRVRK